MVINFNLFSCIAKIQRTYGVITLFVNNRKQSTEVIEDIIMRFYEKNMVKS